MNIATAMHNLQVEAKLLMNSAAQFQASCIRAQNRADRIAILDLDTAANIELLKRKLAEMTVWLNTVESLFSHGMNVSVDSLKDWRQSDSTGSCHAWVKEAV